MIHYKINSSVTTQMPGILLLEIKNFLLAKQNLQFPAKIQYRRVKKMFKNYDCKKNY